MLRAWTALLFIKKKRVVQWFVLMLKKGVSSYLTGAAVGRAMRETVNNIALFYSKLR